MCPEFLSGVAEPELGATQHVSRFLSGVAQLENVWPSRAGPMSELVKDVTLV